MKRLSDFKDEEGIKIAARLMEPIFEICRNMAGFVTEGKTAIEMFTEFFDNCPKQMMHIMAVLSEEDPETYHCDGADVLGNMFVLATDEKLIQLFGLQEQTGDATSSAPVSTSSEE